MQQKGQIEEICIFTMEHYPDSDGTDGNNGTTFTHPPFSSSSTRITITSLLWVELVKTSEPAPIFHLVENSILMNLQRMHFL